MRRRTGRMAQAAGLAGLLLVVSAAALPAEGEVRTLETCDALVKATPGGYISYRCYADLARAGHADGAIRALESILLTDPERHHARAFLGLIEANRGAPRAEELLAAAAEGYAEVGNPGGETFARIQLARFLNRAERFAEAEAELAAAEAVATRAEDPIQQARIWLEQAWNARDTGDQTRFLERLRRAERAAFPDGPPDLRADILSVLGAQYWQESRYEEAREAYLRQAELLRSTGNRYAETGVRFNILLLSKRLAAIGRIGHEDYVRSVREVIALADETGNRRIDSRARHLLGLELPGEEGMRELERSLEISRSIGDRGGERETRRYLAYRLWEYAPERRDEALRLIEEAIADARSTGNLRDVARGLVGKAGMLAKGERHDEWVEAHLAAIEATERMRNLHPGGVTGARLSAGLSFVYYRFVGKLLDSLPVSPDPEGDLDLAWAILERMRTRFWIEALDRGEARPSISGAAAEEDRGEVLREIVETQRKLADDALPAGTRSELLAELERLEAEEAILRDELAAADPGFAALFAPQIAPLDELRESLAPDQAILSYILSTGQLDAPASGSWCFLVTRAGVSVHPLEHMTPLESRIEILLGLLRRRDGSELPAAARLYEDLLAEPLRSIDPGVSKLLIIPDQLLDEVPFAALRPSGDEEPLGVRFSVARAPSVTFWLRASEASSDRDASGATPGSVLSLAVPDLGERGEGVALRSTDPWLEGLRLEQLPRASIEARRVARNLGGASRVVTGPEASEGFLKGADLGPFDILHFAAHAVVDLDHPERSAVILPPGSEEEDGFLQMRDIARLDLRGKVVLLSACRSASGTSLRGEGLVGLSRAFFQAGALAIIGNLWPLHDDEAEALMDDLSGYLAEGMSLGEAVSATRVARMEAGEPAAVWANLTLLGAGDLVPVPGGRTTGSRLQAWLAPLAILALLLGLTALVLRRRRRA